MHLGAYVRVKTAEASTFIDEAYLDKLTSFDPEGLKRLDGPDAVLCTFAHAIDMSRIFHEEVSCVGS